MNANHTTSILLREMMICLLMPRRRLSAHRLLYQYLLDDLLSVHGRAYISVSSAVTANHAASLQPLRANNSIHSSEKQKTAPVEGAVRVREYGLLEDSLQRYAYCRGAAGKYIDTVCEMAACNSAGAVRIGADLAEKHTWR